MVICIIIILICKINFFCDDFVLCFIGDKLFCGDEFYRFNCR